MTPTIEVLFTRDIPARPRGLTGEKAYEKWEQAKDMEKYLYSCVVSVGDCDEDGFEIRFGDFSDIGHAPVGPVTEAPDIETMAMRFTRSEWEAMKAFVDSSVREADKPKEKLP